MVDTVKKPKVWYSIEGLENIKVGDQVAPILVRKSYGGLRGEQRWGGVLHEVTQVGPKRFKVCGDWIVKSTGRQVGRSAYDTFWVLATPEMIATLESNRLEAKRKEEAEAIFYARPEVMAAQKVLNLGLEKFVECCPYEQMLAILAKAEINPTSEDEDGFSNDVDEEAD